MTQEPFSCEMSYMRQLAEQNNKLAFCIEPSHDTEKEKFKTLLSNELDTLIEDKAILNKTTQALNELSMKTRI